MGRRDDESDDDEPMFEFGDQDYGSAAGWEPKSAVDIMLEQERKRNPRAFAPAPNMLFSRPASDWLDIAVTAPPAEPLFGPFWRKGELAILFSSTGLGKSALATQIGESLARGVAIAPFDGPDRQRIEPQNVLYLDCELSLDQFAARYSEATGDNKTFEQKYQFSPRLIRSEFSWDGHVLPGYQGLSDMLFANIGGQIDEYRSTVLIVDNVTFLDSRSTSNSNIALSIMRALNDMKRSERISILVLAHTPKRRPFEPLSERDLQGSINLANFADSMFAMGRSRRSNSLRYLKQIKVRTGRLEYDAKFLPVFDLGKFDCDDGSKLKSRRCGGNFLGFRFVEFAREADHLDLPPPRAKRSDRRFGRKAAVIANAKRLAAEGKSAATVAEELRIPKTTAFRYMKAE